MGKEPAARSYFHLPTAWSTLNATVSHPLLDKFLPPLLKRLFTEFEKVLESGVSLALFCGSVANGVCICR